jgi:hypothetical protein
MECTVRGPAWSLRARRGSEAACDQVAVPAQQRVRPDQQSQPVQQCSQKRPVTRAESHPFLAELALQHRDLMAQGEDLDDLVSVALRQQAQHRERVRHTQIGKSQQHGGPSCRVDHQLHQHVIPPDRDQLVHSLPPGRMSFRHGQAE